jgi:hypothetical protein
MRPINLTIAWLNLSATSGPCRKPNRTRVPHTSTSAGPPLLLPLLLLPVPPPLLLLLLPLLLLPALPAPTDKEAAGTRKARYGQCQGQADSWWKYEGTSTLHIQPPRCTASANWRAVMKRRGR